MVMGPRIASFLVDLEKRIPDLLNEKEDIAALLVASLLVNHGIPAGDVLCTFVEAGLPLEPTLLAGLRDKREDLMTALESLPY